MDPAPSYEASLLRVALTLAALCLGAWWAVRAARRGAIRAKGGRVEVLERVALDGRHALYVVRVAGRTLLLGAGDGALSTLATLDDAGADATGATTGATTSATRESDGATAAHDAPRAGSTA